ncbi:MAG: hypothetical protein LH631_03435 [Alkalinema sp. CAN_BIN05]|nr:hypothetical protein [Alkalinema sp. CAN_BIN05]
MNVLDQVLETVSTLSPDQQEILITLLQRRYSESRRIEILEDAQVSLASFRAGDLRPQSAIDLIERLRRSVQDQ